MDYIYDWVTVKNNTNVLKDASLVQSEEMSQKNEDRKINSTIEPNNGNPENEPKNMINEIKDENNNDEDGIGKKKGKNKNEKCILF